MTDRAYIVSRTLEDKIAIAENNDQNTLFVTIDALKEILALLKDQEAALPTWSQGKAYCGKCGQRLPKKSADREINYCCYCGRSVKWE